MRIHATRPTGGAAEVLLLEPRGDGSWEALARPLRKLVPGTRLAAAAGLEIEVAERLDGGRLRVARIAPGTLEQALVAAGEMPLPPYIHAAPDRPGAVPDRLRAAGRARPRRRRRASTSRPSCSTPSGERCTVVEVDLRIGLDTFRPIATDDLDEHEMHSEAYAVDPDVRALVTRRAGRGPARRGGRHDGGAGARDGRGPGARRTPGGPGSRSSPASASGSSTRW